MLYEVITKELGFNNIINIGYKEGGDADNAIQWASFSHAQFDGIGAFAHQLRKKRLPIKTLPISKEQAPPSSSYNFV